MATLMQNSHDDKVYKDENERLKNETKLVQTCFNLESNLNKLHKNTNATLYDNQKEMGMDRLPHLQLSTYSNTNQHVNKHALNSNNNNNNINPRRPRNFTIESFTNSELVSSSVISTSNTADLSEDEQINYCEDENANLNENLMGQSESASPKKTRGQSNSSDGTLIVLPTNSTITETVNFNAMSLKSPVIQVKLKDLINIDADDEDEHHHEKEDEDENENEENHQNNDSEEEEEDEEEDDVHENENEEGDDEEDDENYENNLITIQYGGPLSSNHEEESSYEKILPKEDESKAFTERIPSPRKIKVNASINDNLISEAKVDLGLAKIQSIPQHPESSLSIDTNVQNDLSDDEVKDYHAFEEDSHA